MSFEPFLDLTLFSFLPAHFPEKDPRQWAEEEGQEETAVHQTIFQPSLRLLRAQTPNTTELFKSPTTEEKRV